MVRHTTDFCPRKWTHFNKIFMPNLLSQKITTEFFNHAVAKNINIRFILIISVIVVVVPICSLTATIFFLLYLVFLFASFQGVFFPFAVAFFLFIKCSRHVLVNLAVVLKISVLGKFLFLFLTVLCCYFGQLIYYIVAILSGLVYWIIIASN